MTALKRFTTLLVVGLAFAACSEEKPKPLSEAGEKLYVMRGKIMARDDHANSLMVDHEAIPGFMEAMSMEYPVRGASVGTLPPDKSKIAAKLHVTERSYWLTDVKNAP